MGPDLGVEKELSRYKIIVSEFPGPATPYSWVLYGCNDENCYSSDTTKLDEQTGFDTITWANKYSNGVSLPLAPYLPEVSVLAAPTYDIALGGTGCVFTASAEEDDTNFGTMSCTFDAEGDSSHVVSSKLFGSDCKSPVTPGLIQENLIPTSTGLTSTNEVPVLIKNSAFDTGTSVEFCIKASVTDGAGVVYDWIGQKVKLAVEVNPVASFSSAGETEVSITVYDGVSNVVKEETSTTSLVVSAYRCDGGGNRVNGQLSQADDFFMCIEGDQNAAVIDVINTLTATKGNKAQELIVEGIQDALKTFVYGLGTNKAIVSTRLSIDFFDA